MREEEHIAMGKLAETIAQLKAAWRDRSRPNQDTEIQTGAVEDKDHRRDADPTLIAELDALEVERGRIQSLLMTGTDTGDQIKSLAERVERLRRDLVADGS